MGEKFFNNLKRYCRTEAGYAELDDVETKQQRDGMESFFFAETLKYLYLLFAPAETLPFERVVFNTEAHPLRRVR
jgi:mannosidase alpha-like ER degradation enhancer 2